MMNGDTKDETASTPAFSRGMTGPYGKFTSEVKTLVDETTFNAWLRLCASKEVTSSEMLRDLVYIVVHSRTPAEIVAEDRRGMLTGEGRNDAILRLRVVDPVAGRA